ncbi:MAG: DnaA regulatory inactivator Hda [Gammaproteobacteria bacterium]|jgi:DnaA family protein
MGEQLSLGLQLKATARFSNFVAGPNGELLAQLRQTAHGRGEAFFLCWGGPNSGKTHLLQASCHEAAAGHRRAAYLSLRDHARLSPALLEGWEQLDLVCLDDVDAVAGSAAWEEALLHLYNRIRESGSSLVVSADAAPAQLSLSLPDLRSRLGWGVVYQLKPLNDSQRMKALQLRARQKGCEMPDETAAYLLRRLPRDLPALFDLLERLDEASLAAQRKLTVPFVKSVLGL